MTESPDNKQSNGRTNTSLSFAKITYVVFLIIAVCFVIRTFWPQRLSIPETINVNIVDTKGKARNLSNEGKAHVKEQLHTALMEVSGKAEVAYNEKFATLLTILAIFGVAWPVIIGLLQLKFNERELQKIDNSVNVSQETQKRVEELLKEFRMQQATEYEAFAEIMYDIGTEACERSDATPRWQSADSHENNQNSAGDFYFLKAVRNLLLESEIDILHLNPNHVERIVKRVSDQRSPDQYEELMNCIAIAKRIYEKTHDERINGILSLLEKKRITRRGNVYVEKPSLKDIDKDPIHPTDR